MQTEFSQVKAPRSNRSARSVERIEALSLTAATFFERYQKQGNPVIVTGLLDREVDWTLEYLCERIGAHEFPVRHYGRDRYQQDKRTWTSVGSGVKAESMSFAHYAELLKSGTVHDQDLYLARSSLKGTSLEDAPVLKQAEAYLGMKMPATSLCLWAGAGEHTSCLHYDPMDSILMQLHGSKKVLLFPPDQLYNLYPFAVANHLRYGLRVRSVYSQVYPEQPDFEAFPRFQQALGYCCEDVLNPGELLFIPAGWWHEVTSLGQHTELVCSVSRFWHVQPLSRALRSWSKWRAHLGGICAAPHTLLHTIKAIASGNRSQELRKLLQRL